MIKETFYRLNPAKKEFILKKAHQVFAGHGYDQITVKDIVKAAEIPRGSFYQYFDTVFDVFQVCLFDISEKKIKFMTPYMSKIGQKPFMEVYRTLIEKGIDFALAHPDEASSALTVYSSLDKQILATKFEMEKQGIQYIYAMIETDQKAGFMSSYIDANILARTLYSFNAYDLIVKFNEGLSKEALMTYADGFLNILENGIL
jgi:AcrR family transcriptional regulator